MKYVLFMSFIFGTLYYYIMESSLPKNSNCSFIATIWTDIIAFIAGFIVIYKGIIYKDSLLIFLAGGLIVEHIWQLLPKFTINKIIFKKEN